MIPSVDLIEPRRGRLTRWIGAATLIGALHIGGGSFATLYWQEEFVEEAPGAIVVEIAPVATALATDTLDLPPGQLSDEREATQAASDPKIAKVQEEAPKEELPSPVESEVVLPKPTAVEEKPKEEPKQEASPQVQVAQEQVAASKATAPLRVDAQIATKAAAPEVGTAVLHLNRHKRYPSSARANDQQGDVHVRFSMDRSGQLTASQVARSSGFALLDEEALELLKRASPLPRPPVAMPGETLELIVPIRFRIK
jgi:protein TonB